jgi:DNA-binding GntR family transcriptional regulator
LETEVEPFAEDRPHWLGAPEAVTLSLPEQIAEKVGSAIIRGRLQPGARILEQDLARRFQVSRGPVREALRILERDRLVQILPRRGAQVTRLSVDEVRDIFDIRTSLIGLAVRLCAERADENAIARLRTEISKLPGLVSDAEDFIAVVYRLTKLIAQLSGNKLLDSMLFAHAHQTLRYTKLGLSTEKQREQIARKWQKMAKALAARECGEARAIAEDLAARTHDLAAELLRSDVQTPARTVAGRRGTG